MLKMLGVAARVREAPEGLAEAAEAMATTRANKMRRYPNVYESSVTCLMPRNARKPRDSARWLLEEEH